MKALLTLIITFTSVFLVAQTTHTWKTNYGTWITESLELSDGNLLLGGYEREQANDFKQLTIFLKSYNIQTGEIKNITPFPSSTNGQVQDIEKVNDNLFVLFNLFGPTNPTGYDIAIGRYDLELNLIELIGINSTKYNFLFIESMHVLSDSLFYISGTHGNNSYFYSEGNYVGIVRKGSLTEEYSTNETSPYFFWRNSSDIIHHNNNLAYISHSTGNNDRYYQIDFQKDTISKIHEFPNNTNQVNFGTSFKTSSVRNIEFIDDTLLFSSCEVIRNWTSVNSSNEIEIYDTVQFGGIFFHLDSNKLSGIAPNKEIDSVKFVPLTNEYGYPDNGPGGSDISEDKEFICLTATVNNVNGHEGHGTSYNGVFGDTVYVNYYPDPNSETGKIVTAKLNMQGDIIWKRIMDEPGAYWIAHQAIANKDGGCTVIGGRYKQGETFLHDPLIIRYDSVGTTTSIQENAKTTLETSVYPQPAINSVSIQWPAQQLAKSTITIYNNQGKQIHLYSTSYNNNLQINVADWSNGVYFFRIHQNNGEVFSGKLMVER